jgi:hypothetical protein
MSMAYADRTYRTNAEGLRVFSQPEDHAAEEAAARRIEAAWGCRLHRFAQFDSIDWWAERDGKMVALVEIKTRSHGIGKYPTVWLNVRKWLALSLGSTGLGVPAVFVVQFADTLRYVNVAQVDASRQRIGGCRQVVKARTDREPVIDVPVEQLREVGRG